MVLLTLLQSDGRGGEICHGATGPEFQWIRGFWILLSRQFGTLKTLKMDDFTLLWQISETKKKIGHLEFFDAIRDNNKELY